MKVEKVKKEFEPVVITLEREEEKTHMYVIMKWYFHCHNSIGHSQERMGFAKDLELKLES